ncbi:SusC/RagA family TonB-linked outer membrane protein [Chryseobacterium koreense]|uniref:Membrane protein n=2 Tax=root TaxID=1 RepID=A0A0J7J0L4_9FLAO|nr:SusC/RagA family TonB-linked outer membrane protein [Chryseobacterium koreense]KMQ71579.1 membrane protein [Chryseobacterium koreense CCUG 49689]MBB5333307.1 iron complex outermembrane receptor protein [Chryseobacterium koreense]
MGNYTTVLKIAPAFLLAGTMMLNAQQTDSIRKETKIEEVVLIGYGKQKKTDLTGSISSISAKDFNGGATSPAQLIQGKTPGVSITGNSGAPGAGSSIRIRGIGTLSASQSPLIVIDGVPQDFNGISGAADPLSLINPNDIETFDILKDASATAIYGNRASNGVILVTTKRGSAGKFKVNFSTLASVSTKMKNTPVLSADEFRTFINKNASDAYKAKLGTADTNWQDLIYQAAWGTDNNIAFTGGIKGLPYRLSLGYNEQNGIVKTNSFRRTSAGLNLTPKFFDNHLSVTVNAKGTFTDNQFAAGGVIGSATYFDPTQPVYSGNSNYGGYYEWLLNGNLNVNANANPLAQLAATRDVSSVLRGLGNIQLDYKFHFLPDMHLNVNAGYDYAKGYGAKTESGLYKTAFADKGRYRSYEQEKKNKLLETYLSYTKTIEAINTNVDLVGGYAYQNFHRFEPFEPTYKGTGKIDPETGNNTDVRNVLISFYGRGIFTIANRYIISASVRRDGSSRFWNGVDTSHLWGTFPGVSVAWKINEESFLKGKGINTLKLRAGWGKTGNQELTNVGDYPAFSSYSLSNGGAQYYLGDQFYQMYRPDIFNPNLTWETTTTENVGLDFGFAKNRIFGSIDLFQKKAEKLLVDSPIFAGDVSNHNVLNAGTMESKGIEGSITVVPIKTENTSWELSFNATHYNSKVTNLVDRADSSFFIPQGGISGGVGNTIQAHVVGNQPYSFYVYQQVYGPDGKPLDGVFVDRNGDGKITEADKYFYKSTQPDVILGFNTKFTYRNWDAGLSARAVIGNYVYNNAASNSSLQSGSTNEYLQNVYNTAVNNNFSIPRYFSDLFVENASFLRLDNVNLGYNFRDIFAPGSSLRVYGMAQNVFVITKYTGVDPEVFGNIDNGYYQMPRVYSLGLNFNF